jgi:hypothetical protein
MTVTVTVTVTVKHSGADPTTRGHCLYIQLGLTLFIYWSSPLLLDELLIIALQGCILYFWWFIKT